MKKICTILALAMISVWSWAAVSITVTPNVIDFGTVYLDENGEAEASEDLTATLTWAGIQQYGNVYVDAVNPPAQDADYEFYVYSSNTQCSTCWYMGDEWTPSTDPTVYVNFYAIAAGEYSTTFRFWAYEADWETEGGNTEFLVKVKVLPHQTTGMESVQKSDVRSQKVIRDGQVLIIRNGETYTVTGAKVK